MLWQKVCYIFLLNIQREHFSPHITRLNQWKNVRKMCEVWSYIQMPETCLQVPFVIMHARLRGHCFVGVYNTSLVVIFSSNQMVKISKESCQAFTCLLFPFLSNRSHTSPHESFFTYLSLDGIIGLTTSLLCHDVLKKPHKATGIKKTGSSFRDYGHHQSRTMSHYIMPVPYKRRRLYEVVWV